MRAATPRMLDRARVLPKTPLQVKRGKLVLRLPSFYSQIKSERLGRRLGQLARLVEREPVFEA